MGCDFPRQFGMVGLGGPPKLDELGPAIGCLPFFLHVCLGHGFFCDSGEPLRSCLIHLRVCLAGRRRFGEAVECPSGAGWTGQKSGKTEESAIGGSGSRNGSCGTSLPAQVNGSEAGV